MSNRRYPTPIVLEKDPTVSSVTSHSGLLAYLDLWQRVGLPMAIDRLVHICGEQGWMDRQLVEAIVLLNLAGGDCVTDIEVLESDSGLCQMVRSGEYEGLGRSARRAAARRFRAGRKRTFPAATQISSFLEACHDAEEEHKRLAGRAFIPAPNEHLLSLRSLNSFLVSRVQALTPRKTATLDGDATLVESDARTALYCYKGFSGYQPYNVWWAEQELVLHSEFRDGNVPAGFEVTRVFAEALACLPEGVEEVRTRQDTAAYDVNFLAWCEREREHPQYGRILFTISADITPEFKEEVLKQTQWTPEWRGTGTRRKKTGREWAEIVWVPNSHAVLTDIREPFRYIAIREKMSDQLSLIDVPPMAKEPAAKLPFPTIVMDNVAYKLHAIVTNRRQDPADTLIQWHFERCGKSEEAHSIMKSDFAGGQMPSAKFGANAAWWALMILAMNFQTAMKKLILGHKWADKRMKAVRFALVNSAGRVVHHSRQFCLRVSGQLHHWLATLREAIRTLQTAPT